MPAQFPGPGQIQEQPRNAAARPDAPKTEKEMHRLRDLKDRGRNDPGSSPEDNSGCYALANFLRYDMMRHISNIL